MQGYYIIMNTLVESTNLLIWLCQKMYLERSHIWRINDILHNILSIVSFSGYMPSKCDVSKLDFIGPNLASRMMTPEST